MKILIFLTFTFFFIITLVLNFMSDLYMIGGIILLKVICITTVVCAFSLIGLFIFLSHRSIKISK